MHPRPFKTPALAAAFSAIGGAMFALQVGFMSPSFVGIVPSIEMVMQGVRDLPGAGAGTYRDGVFAGEGETQHLRLDRRAVREPQVLDSVHQFRRQFEIVETRLAFLGLDDEIFEFPWDHRRLGCTFATWLWRHWRGSRFNWLCLFRRCHRWLLGLGSRCVPRGWLAVIAATGCRGRSTGIRRERLSLAFAEHLLECFEHGDLINWLRNVRRPV